MNWKQISKYAIESGRWRIAKAYIDGCTIYSLHRDDGEAIKFSEDVEELKQLAEEKSKCERMAQGSQLCF